MNHLLIGRKKEQEVLRLALESDEAELISIIGRRRVGKTFLVRSVYQNILSFEFAGIQNGTRKEQLQNFTLRLNRTAKNKFTFKKPNNWLEAFYTLIDYLESTDSTHRKVVFFDELPWLATRKSGFLNAFGVFWNSWASINNVVVVICGSAASWMIKNVVNSRGGLYNRITKRIHLKPFNLLETTLYLKSKNVYLDHYQIVQLYMALGGIPHYLKEVKAGWSATQAIESICFSETGVLRNEFLNLYPALFEEADNHIAIIRALASKHQGMVRNEIIKTAALPNGGNVTKTLEELEQSGFIASFYPFNKKKKEKLFRLTDEYSLFYLQFIEDKIHEGAGIWQRLSQTQAYKTWTGYAYENICFKHIPQIKKALGISGVYALSSTFYKKGTKSEKGTQIDLLIDRNDHVINLFEIKFYNVSFSIDKSYAKILRQKLGVFQETTKTPKQLFWTMITTFGLKHNEHSLGLIQQVLTLENLFEEA